MGSLAFWPGSGWGPKFLGLGVEGLVSDIGGRNRLQVPVAPQRTRVEGLVSDIGGRNKGTKESLHGAAASGRARFGHRRAQDLEVRHGLPESAGRTGRLRHRA